MSTSTLIPETAVNAADGRRDIARGFKLARRWQQQGEWREAEQVYGSILTVEPKHFGSLCGLGAVYKQQGRREEAVALFRRAAATAPDSAEIQTDLGVILANLNQPEVAIACFEKALAANPDDAETVEDLEAVARKMLAHCGVDWEDGCLAFDRTKRPVTSASSIEVRQPIYRHAVGRWRRYANQLGPLFEALEIPVVKAGGPSGRVASNHA